MALLRGHGHLGRTLAWPEWGSVGHVAAWEEGSLASTLTYTPTPTGMAEIRLSTQRPQKCLREVGLETAFPQVISGWGSMPQLLCAHRGEPPAPVSTTHAHIKL